MPCGAVRTTKTQSLNPPRIGVCFHGRNYVKSAFKAALLGAAALAEVDDPDAVRDIRLAAYRIGFVRQ